MDKPFKQLSKDIKYTLSLYNNQNCKTKKWDELIASHDLAYQIGGITQNLLKLNNYRKRKDHETNEVLMENLSDELADTISVCVMIANFMDIDLDLAWKNMIKSDEIKNIQDA